MHAGTAKHYPVEAARFVFHPHRRQQPVYTWRSTWNTGVDSALSLLWKFAFKNGFSGRHVAELVLTAPRGQKTSILKNPQIDLRSSEFIDTHKITQMLRIKPQSLAHAFIATADDKRALQESSDSFRYCPVCLARGLHVSVFQYLFVQSCPIHGRALIERCENCGGIQPYQLSTKTFANPFKCVHCHYSFSEKITKTHARCDLRPFSAELDRWREVFQLTTSKSQLFGSAQLLEQHFSFYGAGAVSLSAPTLARSGSEYYAFIEGLLRCMPGENEQTPTWLQAAEIIELNCGIRCSPKPQRARSARRYARLAKALVATTWDEKYEALLPVYRAIRRHVWRHELGPHRSCVISAARALWWDVEGDVIAEFCPVAEGFLRWRMFWEGYGVPADLFVKPRHLAYGLQTWLSEGAPILSTTVSLSVERWVTHRIFAMDCLRHFYEWRRKCEQRLPRRRRRWMKAEQITGCLSFWLVGNASGSEVGPQIFIDRRDHLPSRKIRGSLASHRSEHYRQLGMIQR